MGRRGPPKRVGVIAETGWSVKPDEAMRQAMAEDLEEMRKLHPKATRSDVVRLWARISKKSRYASHVVDLTRRAQEAERHMLAAAAALAAQARVIEGFQSRQQEKADAERSRVVRALRKAPPNVIEELRDLAAAEAAGLVVEARITLLKEARATFGSYAATLAAMTEGGGQ